MGWRSTHPLHLRRYRWGPVLAGPSARGYRSDRNRNRTPGWNRTTACGFGDRRPTIGPPAYMVRVPHGQRTTVPCVRLPSRPIATPLDGHNNAARQAGHTGPHPKPSTGVPVGCLAGEAGFEPATHGSKDRRAANCTTRLYHAAYAAAMVTVCAPNHPLGTLRRCRRRRTLPACTPPCFAWSATTRWMPREARIMDPYACPLDAGQVAYPFVLSAGFEPAAFRSGGGRPIHWATKA